MIYLIYVKIYFKKKTLLQRVKRKILNTKRRGNPNGKINCNWKFGGYAKSVLDSVDIYNYEIVGFIDEFTSEKVHIGYPIVAHSLDELSNNNHYVYFIAIGNNENEKMV